MSYDIHLNDPVTKQTIELENPHFMRGGTYAIDGTKELSLNITYNYACVMRFRTYCETKMSLFNFNSLGVAVAI